MLEVLVLVVEGSRRGARTGNGEREATHGILRSYRR
jgi:hypothetical protein